MKVALGVERHGKSGTGTGWGENQAPSNAGIDFEKQIC
jgi:hypothetical protein